MEVIKVLVIDDDEVDRLSVKRALTKAEIEFNLYEASNCLEAIALLEKQSFDCIFLDYCLPDGDGLHLVQQIRNAGIRAPLVVLTGQGDEQIAVDLMKAGATDYLSKSRVSSERLLQVVRSALRVYQAEREAELANQRLRETNELLTRKNHELELQRQQIHLQNLKLLENSRLKSQFLATMSHELRTPLNAIIGFSQLLLRSTKKSVLDPYQRDILERILNNGKHLLMLLNEILDFSKLEAGKLATKPKTFDLEQLINTVVSEISSLANEKQLELKVYTHLSNTEIFNDPERLRQVLINLLSNAIKFTPSGKVWLEVKDSLNGIEIAVCDTGIGIPTSDIHNIFEPFRQLDQSIARKHAGTGLGLAITKSLVQMMGGRIVVESQQGKGSIFRVQLPYMLPLEREFKGKKDGLLSSSDLKNHEESPPSDRLSIH